MVSVNVYDPFGLRRDRSVQLWLNFWTASLAYLYAGGPALYELKFKSLSCLIIFPCVAEKRWKTKYIVKLLLALLLKRIAQTCADPKKDS